MAPATPHGTRPAARRRPWAGRGVAALALGASLLGGPWACAAAAGPETAAASGPVATVAATPTAVIGVLAPQGDAAAEQAWAHLGPYLEAAVPGRNFVLRTFDLGGLTAAVARREVDFFIANSGFYVSMEAAHGASRIATLQSPEADSPAAAIASAVFVRSDHTHLRRLADLKGARVAAVGEQAFGGFQVAWRELRRAGVEPHTDFAALQFAGFPMQGVVQAVREGRADAGIVRACLLEALVRRGEARAGEFTVLEPQGGAFACARSTRLYPDWPFAALKHTPHDLAKPVATALLAMPPTASGHAWTVPTDYQPVRELFRELEIGPYADLRERSLAAQLRRHWPWLALVAVLLAAWGVHSLRVERLVQRRTAELRQALAGREQAEAEAHAQQDKLDHLSRLGILGEMSSMLAHELNQPLAAIGNFARGMARRLQAGRLEPGPLLQASTEIAEQAERAGGIMQRIRGFVGKRAVQREPLDLAAVLDDAAALFTQLQTHAPRVELQVAPECSGCRVQADRLQIEQVLLNLLKNAQDAMQAQPADERCIRVNCAPAGDALQVGVLDHGPGLAADAAQRLFEPFFTTKPDGVGLGLAICKRVVEAHGGHIWAEPRAEGGLGVYFTVPRAAAAAAPAQEVGHDARRDAA